MDEIFRDIDENNDDAVQAEIQRLTRSKRGYKAAFTRSANAMDSLINASSSNGNLDRSKSTQEAIARERERLESRYEKLQNVQTRIYRLNTAEDQDDVYTKHIDEIADRYQNIIEELGALMIELLPQQSNNGTQQAHGNVRPVAALQPSFQLSFDNSPTEKAHWIEQFRSYYEASKLNQLDIPEQQAFLRQGVHPDVWTAISQQISPGTGIFHDPDDLEEDSCESLLEDAFTIRYPIILRRFKFFTYKRKGTQTFTNFYAKLRELAAAAQLEHMRQNDYLIYRIMVGINDPPTVDKLLAIPNQDFSLDEVHRVATQSEAASNYSNISRQTNNQTNFTSHSGKNNKQPTIAQKLKDLKEKGKCVRCGKKAHPKGEKCPHLTTKCHNCGKTGHISPVCAQPKSNKQQTTKSHACHTNVTNYTFATMVGSRPSPKQTMWFQDYNNIFEYDVIPDTAHCSKGGTFKIFKNQVFLLKSNLLHLK